MGFPASLITGAIKLFTGGGGSTSTPAPAPATPASTATASNRIKALQRKLNLQNKAVATQKRKVQAQKKKIATAKQKLMYALIAGGALILIFVVVFITKKKR